MPFLVGLNSYGDGMAEHDSAINGGGGWGESKTLRWCAIAGGDCGGLHDIPFRLAEVVVDVEVGVDAHRAGAVFPRGGAVGAERLGIDRALGLDLGELAEDHLGRFRGEDEVGVFDAGPDKLHEAVALVVCIIRVAGRGHLLDVRQHLFIGRQSGGNLKDLQYQLHLCHVEG